MNLLIKNVQVADGEKDDVYKADVLIQGGKISAVGDLKEHSASRIIEGMGNYLTPGFIDVHTEADHSLGLFSESDILRIKEAGITTLAGGQDGFSLAPQLGRLENFGGTGREEGEVNSHWRTLSDFWGVLEKKIRPALNFGTFVGEETARRFLASGSEDKLSRPELAAFKKLLEKNLAEGALGVSSRLHASRRGDYREWLPLLREAGAVWSLRVPYGQNAFELLSEATALADELGVKLAVSHFESLMKEEKDLQKTIGLIRSNKRIFWSFDASENGVYPFSYFLPDWLRESKGDPLALLAERRNEVRLLKSFSGLDFGKLAIVSAYQHKNLVGKTLEEVAEDLAVLPVEAFIHLLRSAHLRGSLVYKEAMPETLKRLLDEPNVFVSSERSGWANGSDRGCLAYLTAAIKEKNLTLARAIKKLTIQPASFLGFRGRGLVKEGYWADLLLLDKDNLTLKTSLVNGGRGGRALRRTLN
ncbi:MAG TPA: amidohydrolase family protein [Candidatus Tyrphobacter sp.]|nr:amidohydrolase family protein [Candidatus Tyrphobacter sp.]